MNDLRLELRTRNNVLWHAIFDNHATVAKFCAAHGLYEGAVGALLNLKERPYLKTGEPSLLASKLCAIAVLSPRELFPPELYTGLIPRVLVAEVEAKHLPLGAARRIALPPSQEDDVITEQRQELVGAALKTLSGRQEKMIRMRYGIGDERESTLDEIGATFAVGKERVRQIIETGLRKMRHPTVSRRLRELV